MFEMMIAEKMKTDLAHPGTTAESESGFARSAQFKPSLMDRVLPAVGQVMINAGLKLKYRQHAKLITEEAHAPNFLIML